jgi:hypothetical protein
MTRLSVEKISAGGYIPLDALVSISNGFSKDSSGILHDKRKINNQENINRVYIF